VKNLYAATKTVSRYAPQPQSHESTINSSLKRACNTH